MVGRTGRASGLDPFLQGMTALGYHEGKSFELDERWGDNSPEVLEREALAALASKPTVCVTQGPALLVARNLPGTIPIVFGASGDPLDLGIAKTLAQPGGRFTGVTFMSYVLVGKRVELLHEVAPAAKRVAVLSNSQHPGDAKEFAATRSAAARLGLQVSHYPVTNKPELQNALAAISAARADALIAHPDALMVQERSAIAAFALERRMPAISGWAVIAEGGSLLTYGPNLQQCYRRLAHFVDRILRGAKPGDLPIELPNTVEFVVNLKTAKALGITVPPALLLRADRVIV
jgi:putative ABC transport system substrate-binding protein